MRWTDSIIKTIDYIEKNITSEESISKIPINEALTIKNIAAQACMSPFYFQKGFAMLCGFTVSEYIRCRKMSLAGSEVAFTDKKVIDIALKYGYDSPDSFTKSFTRFHGATPTAVRKGNAIIKSFASLKIKFTLVGGYSMDYKIVEKDAFTVMGSLKVFKYENAVEEVPDFWARHFEDGNGKIVCGTYGVNIDESMAGNEFEYLIADNYNPIEDVPKGFVTRVIPKHTWAVFPCVGAMPNSMQEVNKKIFSEWLPGCKEYEIAAGYNIEMYNDPADYAKGTQDEEYYTEIWIPIKRK